MSAQLKFYSWLRKGLSLGLTQVADESGLPTSSDATLSVGVRISGLADTIGQTLRLRTAGDVVGLDQAQVLRAEPRDGTQDFEPNFFPFIEFVSPEIPWLFTSTAPGTADRLCPWLVLVVLEKGADYTVVAGTYGTRKVLSVNSGAGALLPPLSEAYAWAHVQEDASSAAAATDVSGALEDEPERFLSRLICPVKLKAATAYEAFLVPAFEAGRLAGLGQSPSAAGAAAAWTDDTAALDLPVYYTWSFRTGEADFETLVRRLAPYPADASVGVMDLDISTPRGGLNAEDLGGNYGDWDNLLVSFSGALVSPVVSTRSWKHEHKADFQEGLETVLFARAAAVEDNPGYDALTDDPVVTPPVYGTWQAGLYQANSLTRAALPAWMDDVNFTPSHRGVAGTGGEVVRKNQETFMQEAWEGASNVRQVQSELRRSRMALQAGSVMHTRLSALGDEGWLQLSSPANRRMKNSAGAGTVHAALKNSAQVPSGVMDAGFRRQAARHQKTIDKISTTLAGTTLVRSVTNACVTASPSVLALAYPRPATSLGYEKDYTVTESSSSARKSRTSSRSRSSRASAAAGTSLTVTAHTMATLATGVGAYMPGTSVYDFSGLTRGTAAADVDLESVAAATRLATAPETALKKSLFNRIKGLAEPAAGAVAIPKRAQVSFEFDEPLYKKLQDLNPEFLLPGFGTIPANSVSLLATNAEFVESCLLGANHEMSREFAWREYPASLDGTWFRRFWDYLGNPEQTDIEPVSEWKKRTHLGRNAYGSRAGDSQDRAVLLIKGDLLRRYPNTMIYAVRAKWAKKTSMSGATWSSVTGKDTGSKDKWTRTADLSAEDNIRLPIFKGEIGTDAHFLGFDLAAEDLIGSSTKADGTPGWFFVFEEFFSEPKFGLDAAAAFSPGTIQGGLT